MNLMVPGLSRDLFSRYFTLPRLQWTECDEKYVNDKLDRNELKRWDDKKKKPHSGLISVQYNILYYKMPTMPVFISAPTGYGKNYFVLHNNLRDFAQEHGERILYFSNRVALDAQMRKGLVEITGVESRFDKEFILDEYTEDFGNITVMTYQKLTRLLVSQDTAFLKQKFDYVVCDEAHFFVADALFNPNTGDLLDKLVENYWYSTRIYTSATFDEALEPILRAEVISCHDFVTNKVQRNAVCDSDYEYDFANNSFAYSFSRDFISYRPHFFNDLKEIEDAIASDYLGKTKWLIFVNSRDEGKQLAMRLNSEFKKHCDGKIKELKKACDNSTTIEIEVKKPYQDFAVFIDRYSRHKDDVSGEIWRKLINTGVLPCKVLIATSVLDNGFSIKDDLVKNVVICTDDKVEFLQELGRRRILSDQDSVELYIRKVTPMSLSIRKRYLERQLEFYDIAYGGLQAEDREDLLADAFIHAWNHDEASDFKYLKLVRMSPNRVCVYINYLAKWKILCLKEEIERYEELVAQYGQETASVIYKAEWIDLDPAKAVQISELGSAPMVDLIDFLEEYVSSESNLYLNDPSFERFSRDFQDLFHRAFPDEKINTGKNRAYWKAEAINNHLDKIDDKLKLSSKYVLNQISEKYYRLEKH